MISLLGRRLYKARAVIEFVAPAGESEIRRAQPAPTALTARPV
jgi:hypothetical protein